MMSFRNGRPSSRSFAIMGSAGLLIRPTPPRKPLKGLELTDESWHHGPSREVHESGQRRVVNSNDLPLLLNILSARLCPAAQRAIRRADLVRCRGEGSGIGE